MTYFDQPENNTGALCTRLATEASDVQGVRRSNIEVFFLLDIVFLQATGIRIGVILQNISNLGVGLILAFIYGWSLTLIALAFIPFVIIGGFLQTFLLTGFASRVKIFLENNKR